MLDPGQVQVMTEGQIPPEDGEPSLSGSREGSGNTGRRGAVFAGRPGSGGAVSGFGKLNRS